MKKEKNTDGFPNIGLSSLLIIFLIVCMTTFALLALSTAKSDYTLSEKFAGHRTDYYTASSKAEEILSQIDSTLEADLNTVISQTAFTINDTVISVIADEDFPLLTYTVPMENNQFLSVKIQVTDPASSEHYYKILEWKVSEKQ